MNRTLVISLIAAALTIIALVGYRMSAPLPGPVAPVVTPTPAPTPAAGPARVTSSGALKVTAALTSSHLLHQSDGKIAMAVTVTSGPGGATQRLPVDLVLVLDRSGSMAGDKIERAREAAREMIRRLAGSDRVSLIIYDTTVDVLAPLTQVNAGREKLLALVDTIQDRSSTNLGGGLEAAYRQLQDQPTDGARVQRVILISDGIANVGVTDPTTLGQWAESARQRSISLSTMGVGLDYNEDLMISLADHGGGAFNHIKDASSLAQIFSKELDSIFSTVARKLVLEVRPADGVRIDRVFGYPTQELAGRTLIPLGDLAAESTRSAVLELNVVVATLGPRPVVDLRLSYQNMLQDGRAMEQALSLATVVTGDPELVRRGEDRAALEQSETALAAVATQEALKLYEAGKVEEARKMAQINAERTMQMSTKLGSARLKSKSAKFLMMDSQLQAAPSAASESGRSITKGNKMDAYLDLRK